MRKVERKSCFFYIIWYGMVWYVDWVYHALRHSAAVGVCDTCTMVRSPRSIKPWFIYYGQTMVF